MDQLIRDLFSAVGKGGYVVRQIEPHDLEKRIPALAAHSDKNIHGAVALGGARELLVNLKAVMSELFGMMQGDFRRPAFEAQRQAITADLANFLLLEERLNGCPALIVASSDHLSLEQSPKLKQLKRNYRLTPSWSDEDGLGRSHLALPRLGLRIDIQKYEERFERPLLGGKSTSLVWVQREFTSKDAAGNLVQKLITEALGFAPDRHGETLVVGNWHEAGRGAEWTVVDDKGATLLTRNHEIDAWLFLSASASRKHVIGEHLHMALNSDGMLFSVDLTERYLPPYIELNRMLRCAVEKAVYGYVMT